MKYYHNLAAAIIGASIVLVQPQPILALSSIEISEIAKEITVLIQAKGEKYSGSGTIINREGDTYTVITCAHVVERALDPSYEYEIVTPDEKRYLLDVATIKKLPDVDLVTVQFRSSENYQIAVLGNSDLVKIGMASYVAGFPTPTEAITRSIYTFSVGIISANASKPLDDGYALVYSNNTLGGMSGGPVLNENGEVIGIHGRADGKKSGGQIVKTDYNLGIPINTFVKLSSSAEVATAGIPSEAPETVEPLADDHLLQAGNKYKQGDFKGALAAYSQAISLNPNYAEAYKNRGNTRSELGDKKGALEDYNQALNLNPNYTDAYYNRGIVHYELGNKQEALEDYNQALSLNPNDADAYYNRGIVRYQLGYHSEAIADLQKAANLFNKQGNRELYQQTMNTIRNFERVW